MSTIKKEVLTDPKRFQLASGISKAELDQAINDVVSKTQHH